MLTSRGLGVVLADLSQMGFDAKWGVVSAADVGANHQRERIWIVAHANSIWRRRWNKLEQSKGDTSRESISISSKDVVGQMAYTDSTHSKRNKCAKRSPQERADYGKSSWWSIEPNVGRVADGMAARVDRLKAIGNGQVPLCAATAWELLK
jgi:DNA (cytosine-5)-methyltransferase 1